MSENIHKSHNVSRLMYHFVFPTKYRRVVIDEEVDKVIKETCIEISKRYEVEFLEIGTDKDHVHFLVQSVPNYSPTQIVKIIKSITAREVFAKCPEVKKKLWGGNFWSSGYYVAESAKDFVPSFLKHGATAIVCGNDLLAYGVMEECMERGFKVPEDISVIGFDDLPQSSQTKPALTTIRQERIELGKCGYFSLNSLMNHVSVSKTLLRPKFIVRESTAPLRTG